MSRDEGLIKEFKAEREKRGLPPSRLRDDGDGPYDGDMQRRIENLEADMKDVKKDLAELKVSLSGIKATLDILTKSVDKLDSKIPTGWAMIGMFGSIVTMLSIVCGLFILVLKWLGVIHIPS